MPIIPFNFVASALVTVPSLFTSPGFLVNSVEALAFPLIFRIDLLNKQNLPNEPDENHPDVCKIMFRYPNGEKNVERRFLKTDRISILYVYIKSLGREIFMESSSNDFDLFSLFPTKNLENSKNSTLEQEGLFPSSMIQIREK